MTGGTARQLLNLIFLHQPCAQDELILRRLIVHAEHVFPGTHKTFRMAVAVEAPIHIKRIFPPRQWHLIDRAMTSGAADSLVDVNAMIKVNEAGKIMDPSPLDGLPGAKTFSHRFQHRAVCPDLSVTVHARLGRRNAGERTFLDRGMAIAAIDAVIADMVFMAKRHRLTAGDTSFRYIGGFIDGG